MSFIREQIGKRLTRSPEWPKVRKTYLKANKVCAACGRKTHLEVHHIEDFSTHPERELDSDNLITLCDHGTRCHFVLGHLGDWKSINPGIEIDARWYRDKIRLRRRYGSD